MRRGLPRVRGGEPWPEGVTIEVAEAAIPDVDAPATAARESVAPAATAPAEQTSVAQPTPAAPAPVAAPAAAAASSLRRGLPRVAGGDPWPPSDSIRPAAAAAAATAETPSPTVAATVEAVPAAAPAQASAAAASAVPAAAASGGAALRRGLPRVDGGEPWPPAGVVAAASAPAEGVPGSANAPAEVTEVVAAAIVVEDGAGAVTEEIVGTTVVSRPGPDVSTPLPFRRTVWNGTAPRHDPPAGDQQTGRPRPTWVQGIAGLFAAASLGVIAVAVVALVRALLSMPALQDFLLAYPGEYEPAVHVEPGFAPWIGWQHFFNMFLMILIIRSGLRVRSEKRPTAFWTPKGNAKGKISLTLWFHQALDLLWIINGVIFVVLLFATGHWARIVPTSWEVIPNAISAGLQYVSLDWPHENGWNNYNSLQQLAYFATVFLAAPLAIVTGFRMSGLWPKKAERLSKAYPIEWARAVHFPVMLYFVAFIIVHVALVVFTGFLANLGHMYASTDVLGWTGFWVFVASLVVIAIGWWAARPLVIAPIAKLFGQVTAR